MKSIIPSITGLATNSALKKNKNKLKNLKTFDLRYFEGKCYFEEDGTQNDLVFQPMHKYLKSCAGVCSGNYIYF